jgi:hypothetical protein
MAKSNPIPTPNKNSKPITALDKVQAYYKSKK